MTNAAARQILDADILPRFAQGDFDEALRVGVKALIRRIDTANVPAGPIGPASLRTMKEAA